MRVSIRLHGTLRKFLPSGTRDNLTTVELSDGASVADAIARLGIPAAHAKMFVSGDEHLEATSVLRDGQEVNVFPPLAGGID